MMFTQDMYGWNDTDMMQFLVSLSAWSLVPILLDHWHDHTMDCPSGGTKAALAR
jgi:hypothetical protein